MARGKTTWRTCALTRQERETGDLIRFALSPEGDIVPDIDAKAPGRGVWITLSREAVRKAAHKNVFAKSLKTRANLPGDLAFEVHSRLEQRLLGALGMARKAGSLLTGAAKVGAALEGDKALALFTATDAAPDGRRKILQAARRAGRAQALDHFELLTAEQLGLALGLESVIHAALIPGAASNSALERARRLARFDATAREEDGTL